MTDETNTPQEELKMTPEANEAATGEEQMPLPEVRVEDVLGYAVGLLSDTAWIKLGIRANPVNGETNFDGAQAKLAIDALAALIPLLDGRIDAHVLRDLRNQLSSLQMNYVQRA